MSVQNPKRQYHVHGGIRHIGTTPYRCIVATLSHKKAVELIGTSIANFKMYFNEDVSVLETMTAMANKEMVFISPIDLDPPLFKKFERRG
jgi:hypothetical protein